jgi:hypothetical protein
MYDFLSPGGTLVAVTGPGWTLKNNRKRTDFGQWLDGAGARVYDIPKGAFKESGTEIATNVAVINKRHTTE